MTYRTIILTAAIAAVTMLGTIGSASAGGGGKTTFERYKPHVNVGTIGHVKRQKASGQTKIKNTGTQAKGKTGALEALHPTMNETLGVVK